MRIGVDVTQMWCTMSRGGGGSIGEACLAVRGAGRTATLVMSSPESGERSDNREAFADRQSQLAATIRAACEHLRTSQPEIRIVQSILEVDDLVCGRAFAHEGFIELGPLEYLRRPGEESNAPGQPPSEVRIRALCDLSPTSQVDVLIEVLNRTYVGTLDCPELAGLRETRDVLESHFAVGRHDPRLWWIAYGQDHPIGCVLLNPMPDGAKLDLVYLGLDANCRGRGLGRWLLRWALWHGARRGVMEVTCAVDSRNVPAVRAYRREGFSTCSVRRPYVRSLA
jgi:ribosomal protein S18 acetylase RimI-like enzyme